MSRKIKIKTLKQTYFIHAPVTAVWSALVNPKFIDAWGGGPATMDDQVGTQFSLWGGSIWGINKEVVKKEKLVQDWYSTDDHRLWSEPSVVTFTLHQGKSGTRLDLLHANVPDADAADIDSGWRDYYLGPLKEYLEKSGN